MFADPRQIGFGDEGIDAERQMRPVLLDRGERQYGDPAPGFGAGDISCQVISIQSRFGNVTVRSPYRCRLSYCRVAAGKEQPMLLGEDLHALALVAAFAACGATAGPGLGQALDKVTFGTNWVAEAEHGGFYQALADGTYRKYGLDVTILPGGPNANNRILLPVGKIDFFLSANTLQGFDAVDAEHADDRSRRACSRRTRRSSSRIPTRASTNSRI